MIAINKQEASQLREMVEGLHIRRTVHKWYVEESKDVLNALKKIKENSEAR